MNKKLVAFVQHVLSRTDIEAKTITIEQAVKIIEILGE